MIHNHTCGISDVLCHCIKKGPELSIEHTEFDELLKYICNMKVQNRSDKAFFNYYIEPFYLVEFNFIEIPLSNLNMHT